jgi:hypothetical protein
MGFFTKTDKKSGLGEANKQLKELEEQGKASPIPPVKAGVFDGHVEIKSPAREETDEEFMRRMNPDLYKKK